MLLFLYLGKDIEQSSFLSHIRNILNYSSFSEVYIKGKIGKAQKSWVEGIFHDEALAERSCLSTLLNKLGRPCGTLRQGVILTQDLKECYSVLLAQTVPIKGLKKRGP